MRNLVLTGCCPLGPFGLGRTALTSFLASTSLPSPSGRIAPLDVLEFLETRNKRTKKMDRLSGLVSVTALQALTEARVDRGSVPAGRGAVVTGSGRGALASILEFHRQIATTGPDSVDPGVFPPTSHNVAGGHVSIEFGLSGPLLHLASGRAASADALVVAADLLRAGRADVAVTGGFDLLGGDVEAMLGPVEAPALPPAETVVMLVLEGEDGPRSRGVTPLARVEGWATARLASASASVASVCTQTMGNGAGVDLVVAAHPLPPEAVEGLRQIFDGSLPTVWEAGRLIGDTSGAAFALAMAAALVALETGVPSPDGTGPRASNALVLGLSRGQAVALRLSAPEPRSPLPPSPS